MKILIIKSSALGDIIHAFPALHYLHAHYPDAQIDWVVEQPFANLVQSHPFIHEVICVQTKKWRKNPFKQENRQEIREFCEKLRRYSYDLVFDLQGNMKSGLITALAKSPLKIGFGYQTAPEKVNSLVTHQRYNPPNGKNIREDYLFLVQSACGDFNQKEERAIQLKIPTSEEQHQLQAILAHSLLQKRPCIMVCPGSNWTNKQLDLKTLKEFLGMIHRQLQASFILIWGSQAEKLIVEEIAHALPQHCLVIDRLLLSTLQNLMSGMDLIIAMDSLPLHLAGTTQVPTYSVFGASLAAKYKPVGGHHHAFQGECPYQTKQFEKRCPILRTCSTGACIKDLQAERVFDHFMAWWRGMAPNR